MKKIYVALMLFVILPIFHQCAMAEETAWFDGGGMLVINGRKVFPIGVRTEKKEVLKEIADCGFNMVMASGEWTQEHFDEAQKNKLLVIAGHHVWMAFRGVQEGLDLSAREETLVKNVVMKARDQNKRKIHEAISQFDKLPGVIGWVISDEPEAKMSELGEAGYEIFKSNTPGHIVMQISCDPHWFKNFRHSTDVLVVDHYPFQGIPERRKYRRSICDTYTRAKKAVDDMGGKPVWLMPQLYPPSYWTWKKGEELSLRDMRLANYSGLAAGVTGIIMYHWEILRWDWDVDADGKRVRLPVDADLRASRIANIKKMVAELKQIAPIVALGAPVDDLRLNWLAPGRNGPGPQVWRAWEYAGKRYLLLVNYLDQPLKGQVFGINASVNYRAYIPTVFAGADELKVEAEKRKGEYTFTLGPRGAGILELSRIPIEEVKVKKD